MITETHVLKRLQDGKYLGVNGHSVQWTNDPRHAMVPIFTPDNLGERRRDDFHKMLVKAYTSGAAKRGHDGCQLVPIRECV